MTLPVEKEIELAEPVDSEGLSWRQKVELMLARLLTIGYLGVYFYFTPFIMLSSFSAIGSIWK